MQNINIKSVGVEGGGVECVVLCWCDVVWCLGITVYPKTDQM
jgi:hypothetical protein